MRGKRKRWAKDTLRFREDKIAEKTGEEDEKEEKEEVVESRRKKRRGTRERK